MSITSNTPNETGFVVVGSIDADAPENTTDYIELSLDYGESVSISLTWDNQETDLDLSLYSDAEHSESVASDVSSDHPETVSYSSEIAQNHTYYIEILAYSGSATYELTVSVTPAAFTGLPLLPPEVTETGVIVVNDSIEQVTHFDMYHSTYSDTFENIVYFNNKYHVFSFENAPTSTTNILRHNYNTSKDQHTWISEVLPAVSSGTATVITTPTVAVSDTKLVIAYFATTSELDPTASLKPIAQVYDGVSWTFVDIDPDWVYQSVDTWLFDEPNIAITPHGTDFYLTLYRYNSGDPDVECENATTKILAADNSITHGHTLPGFGVKNVKLISHSDELYAFFIDTPTGEIRVSKKTDTGWSAAQSITVYDDTYSLYGRFSVSQNDREIGLSWLEYNSDDDYIYLGFALFDTVTGAWSRERILYIDNNGNSGYGTVTVWDGYCWTILFPFVDYDDTEYDTYLHIHMARRVGGNNGGWATTSQAIYYPTEMPPGDMHPKAAIVDADGDIVLTSGSSSYDLALSVITPSIPSVVIEWEPIPEEGGESGGDDPLPSDPVVRYIVIIKQS
jgi:hypothetical protein